MVDYLLHPPDEMEKLTMPRNRIPKAIHSRTMAQSVFVNLVAQLILSFSQPMVAQSQKKPVTSAGQTSQALYEARQMFSAVAQAVQGKPTRKWSKMY